MNPAGSDLDFAGLLGGLRLPVGAAVLASERSFRLAGLSGLDGLEGLRVAHAERVESGATGGSADVHGLVHFVRRTCRLIATVIPPLIRLGLIDQTGCVVLGAVIGIVVASMSILTGSELNDPYTTAKCG